MFVYDYKFLVALFILAGTAVALVGWAVYSIIKKMIKRNRQKKQHEAFERMRKGNR